MQNGRAGRLHPAVGTARRHLAAALEKLLGAGSIKATGRSRTASTADAADLPLLLVACSGGPTPSPWRQLPRTSPAAATCA